MLGKLKKRRRLRKHGFLARGITATGRNVLKRRRQKGRHQLTPSYPIRLKSPKGNPKFHIVAKSK
ncbi:50S ribosomal protein L34 [Candidatus Peribacteria bacterium]|nr:50S ribosomal protein L34 [Candidatus Peribacteria bacterium]